jgi:hypothetical protein
MTTLETRVAIERLRDLKRWAVIAALKPGQPVFREVIKGGEIAANRLTDRSVARIIKRRVRPRALELCRSESEADELADAFSGHSLRHSRCDGWRP